MKNSGFSFIILVMIISRLILYLLLICTHLDFSILNEPEPDRQKSVAPAYSCYDCAPDSSALAPDTNEREDVTRGQKGFARSASLADCCLALTLCAGRHCAGWPPNARTPLQKNLILPFLPNPPPALS